MRAAVAAWLLVLGAAVVGCTGEADDAKDERKGAREVPPTVVATAQAAVGSVDEVLEASGTVEARASADLVPASTGRVLDVRVEVGDRVRKGDVLVVIRNEAAQGSAQRATDEVRHLEATLAELDALFGQGAVSAREVADARFNLDQARLRLTEARAAESDTRLVAPFAGVVAVRDVKIGEMASGGTRAVQVVDPSELLVRARLPEQDLGRVATGQQATLRSAYDDTQAAPATVARVAPVVDSQTGTFEVLLSLDPSQQALRPGQYVRISLVVDRRDDVVVVPREAVRYDNGRALVWTVGPAPAEAEAPEAADAADGQPASNDAEPAGGLSATRTPVEVGLVDATRAEIVAGLAVGTEVVTVGHASLRDGARVRRPGEPEAAAATPPADPAGGDAG